MHVAHCGRDRLIVVYQASSPSCMWTEVRRSRENEHQADKRREGQSSSRGTESSPPSSAAKDAKQEKQQQQQKYREIYLFITFLYR